MKKYIYIVFIILLASCTSDFEKINKNIYGAGEEDIKMGGLAYGAPFMKMQQLVIPIGSPERTTGPGNDLQNTDLISSGNYIGYFGNNNNWNFNLESNWNFVENRMTYAYENFYSNTFRAWNEINQLASKSEDPSDKQILALANIVKVASWLRATDVFGPIPYTQAGKGSITPEFDSQEVVYKNMLKELSECVKVLQKATATVLENYDVIYDGDASKWVKFANSLMLRIAVRTHFKDNALAKEYIAKALAPENGGVISSIDEEAKIQNSAKMPLINSFMASVEEYGETRMGTTIWSYLKGYDDPRINKYFTKGVKYNRSKFYPIAPANIFGKITGSSSPQYASKPRVNNNTPIYWLRASEVLFLKAEAALYKLTAGDAKVFYEAGISMSFAEHNAYGAESYITNTNKPQDMKTGDFNNTYAYGGISSDYTWITYNFILSEIATSPSWEDINADSQLSEEEQKFQKIITQKYLALYPNAVEAWTEYRRTGYPFITPPFDKEAPKRIGCEECLAPERFKFSASEYSNNPNMAKVPTLLGGEDIGSTKLWWVRDNRPKQSLN